ncbi:hypothetical protein POG06_09380 [Enterococcus innesii]|nr:hypothetical protein [Enterococcus innesii]
MKLNFRKRVVIMAKVFLIPKCNLVVLSLPCSIGKIDKEEKERIKSELKESTGMHRALVVEGNFEYIP